MRHLFRVKNIDHWGSNWPLGAKMCFFLTQKFGYLVQKVNFLYGNRDFWQRGISPVCPGLQLSHSDNPEKKIVFELWVIFWGSPQFLANPGLCHFRIIIILNFGLSSTKLGWTVQAIKKLPTMTPDLKRLIFFFEKGTFLFAHLFPVVTRTWLEPRSGLFLSGPENLDFGPKILFLPYNPKFC